jgi:hypothetical protein
MKNCLLCPPGVNSMNLTEPITCLTQFNCFFFLKSGQSGCVKVEGFGGK